MNTVFKNVIKNHITKSIEEVKKIIKASIDYYHLKTTFT